jgi:hypothetical protein
LTKQGPFEQRKTNGSKHGVFFLKIAPKALCKKELCKARFVGKKKPWALKMGQKHLK